MIKFYKALPIWPEGKEKEMNLSVGSIYNFTVQKACNYKISLTGSTLYRVYINGKFVHYGPARGPHGYARVDEIDFGEVLKEGINTLAIEVAGYNCNSYYTLNVPSFLQAEVYENGEVIGYTEPKGEFNALVLSSRVQKTMRYSFQRPFSEVYKFDNNEPLYNWKTEPLKVYEKLDVVNLDLKYLPRQLQTPDYNLRNVNNIIEYGIGERKTKQKDFKYYEHNFIYQISDVRIKQWKLC